MTGVDERRASGPKRISSSSSGCGCYISKLVRPLAQPRDWVAQVNRAEPKAALDALRLSVQRGRPFGEAGWVRRMARRFMMESTLRPHGRPKGS